MFVMFIIQRHLMLRSPTYVNQYANRIISSPCKLVSTYLKCPVSTPNLDGRLWKSTENYEVILDAFAVNFLPSYVITFLS